MNRNPNIKYIVLNENDKDIVYEVLESKDHDNDPKYTQIRNGFLRLRRVRMRLSGGIFLQGNDGEYRVYPQYMIYPNHHNKVMYLDPAPYKDSIMYGFEVTDHNLRMSWRNK